METQLERGMKVKTPDGFGVIVGGIYSGGKIIRVVVVPDPPKISSYSVEEIEVIHQEKVDGD